MNELYALKRQNLGYVNYIFTRLLKNAVAYFVRFPGLFFSSFLSTLLLKFNLLNPFPKVQQTNHIETY